MNGYKVFWTWRIMNRVLHSLVTELSMPYPESWGAGVSSGTFPKDNKENA